MRAFAFAFRIASGTGRYIRRPGPDINNVGTITSGDYNIIQNPNIGNGLMGTITHVTAVDPQLLPLANNGGPTFTDADQSTSPGRGAIPFSANMCGNASVQTDQRGYIRGAGGCTPRGRISRRASGSAISCNARQPSEQKRAFANSRRMHAP